MTGPDEPIKHAGDVDTGFVAPQKLKPYTTHGATFLGPFYSFHAEALMTGKTKKQNKTEVRAGSNVFSKAHECTFFFSRFNPPQFEGCAFPACSRRNQNLKGLFEETAADMDSPKPSHKL